jgi:hypothetical protein
MDDFTLSNCFVLWAHDINNKDWDINSYKEICKVPNATTFWKLFNNFDKIWGHNMYAHYFFMREGIKPIWEDENNRSGGMCSFKLEIADSLNVWTDLATRLVCDLMTKDSGDITGISISPKNNWAIIKVWNRDNKNDLSKTLDQDILKKYAGLSIKYKSNNPEY